MTEQPEKIKSSETLMSQVSPEPKETALFLEPEVAEKMFQERRMMLGNIEKYLPAAWKTRLAERVEAERQRFLRLIRMERNARERLRDEACILNSRYFEKRPLEINIFE